LAAATGGASEASSKAAKLAELFRPPFDLMARIPWDDARQQGKEESKWILVNVQDPSIFDCQSLNRDIWKHEGIKETIKENFIFMQYDKDDPRGNQYIQYYFPLRDSDAAYPHIAIVDPRTGEQVKVWSGPPVPKPMDFLMQLHEFLDRYSLNVSVRNPVAKRKPERSASIDVDKLTEDQMLELALQNSLANGTPTGPKDHDPDDLTKSISDLGKGKGKGANDDSIIVESSDTNGYIVGDAPITSPFTSISSTTPHTEPAINSATTTRIQFRHASGRIIRRFDVSDPVRRIYEWLKAEPIDGKAGANFELKAMGRDLIGELDKSIGQAGLSNGTIMVEYLED
jgi:UBX domain-containing protein 7